MELLDKLQNQIYWSAGPSLEPLDGSRNVASLNLFYRYYFGICSYQLAQLAPLSYSQGRCTHYSDILHDFSVTIRRYSKDVYVNSFFLQSLTLGFSGYRMFSFDL